MEAGSEAESRVTKHRSVNSSGALVKSRSYPTSVSAGRGAAVVVKHSRADSNANRIVTPR